MSTSAELHGGLAGLPVAQSVCCTSDLAPQHWFNNSSP
jgi:hypothetical protein